MTSTKLQTFIVNNSTWTLGPWNEVSIGLYALILLVC